MAVVEREYKQKLNSLLQITQAINSNFSKDQLLRIYESILKNQLGVTRYLVYSVTRDGLNTELFGGIKEPDLKNINIGDYLRKIIDPQEIIFLSDSTFDLFDVLIPVFHKNQPLAYVFLGDVPRSQEEEFYREHLPFIQALTNIIYVAFENKEFAREKIRQERLKKELELASEMQNMLFPDAFPETNNVEVEAFYKSHIEVGGDYYDFFKLNAHEYAICIADVSGKGISAALLMSNFQANVRALFNYTESLQELTAILNDKVEINAKGEKFITAFLARYDSSNHKFSYVNAGHNPPILVQNDQVELLKEGTIGLGMMDKIPFLHVAEKEISPNALLLCYTDGLTELENNEGKYFGLDKLIDIVFTNRKLGVKDLITQIILSLEKFKQDQPYKDDIALIACRFH
jgi:phosphoserine phosphatase RsbU/P